MAQRIPPSIRDAVQDPGPGVGRPPHESNQTDELLMTRAAPSSEGHMASAMRPLDELAQPTWRAHANAWVHNGEGKGPLIVDDEKRLELITLNRRLIKHPIQREADEAFAIHKNRF